MNYIKTKTDLSQRHESWRSLAFWTSLDFCRFFSFLMSLTVLFLETEKLRWLSGAVGIRH